MDEIQYTSEEKGFVDSCEDFGNEMVDMLESLQHELQKKFHGKLKFVFANFPNLKSIDWRQYTPSWCDGDVCSLRSNHDEPEFEYHDNDKFSEEEEDRIMDIVGSFMVEFSDWWMGQVFGDPVSVSVTENEIDITGYEPEY